MVPLPRIDFCSGAPPFCVGLRFFVLRVRSSPTPPCCLLAPPAPTSFSVAAKGGAPPLGGAHFVWPPLLCSSQTGPPRGKFRSPFPRVNFPPPRMFVVIPRGGFSPRGADCSAGIFPCGCCLRRHRFIGRRLLVTLSWVPRPLFSCSLVFVPLWLLPHRKCVLVS